VGVCTLPQKFVLGKVIKMAVQLPHRIKYVRSGRWKKISTIKR